VVRFARLIHRPVRVLGGPAVRAACGGNVEPDLVATQGGVAARLAGVGRAIKTLDSSTSLGGLSSVSARPPPPGR
jgi:hypothetical protein